MRWSRRETRLEDVTAHTIKALSRPNGPELVFGPDLARSWALARQDASAQAEPGEYEERRKAGEAGGIAGSLGRNFHRKRVAMLHYRLVSLADDLQAGGVGSASSHRGDKRRSTRARRRPRALTKLIRTALRLRGVSMRPRRRRAARPPARPLAARRTAARPRSRLC